MADATTTPTDGRSARRQRNVDLAIEAAAQAFRDGNTSFTLEEIAERVGLSGRSLYRYFDDWTELRDAALAHADEAARTVGAIELLGEGTFDERIDAFVAARLRLHRAFGTSQQAMLAHAFQSAFAKSRVQLGRRLMRQQLEAQFATEFDRLAEPDRSRVIAAADLLTQLESVHYLRIGRQFSVKETSIVLADGLRTLLV